MRKSIIEFIKKEKVFVIAAIAAAISVFFVPPSVEYIGYLNFRVLFILFSLMTVTAGFQSCNVFVAGANLLCTKMKSLRSISIALIICCFFFSMLITNDVALITFVPFTLLITSKIKCEKSAAFIIVLETIAANLGSMLTPLGNPQNLFLYTQMNESIEKFILILLPYTAFAFVLIIAFCFFISGKPITLYSDNINTGNNINDSNLQNETANIKTKLAVYSVLFVLCILCVLRIIPAHLLAIIILLSALATDRKLLFTVDYMLLLTFCAFFIFTGNIGNIQAIKDFLHSAVNGNEFVSGVISSQVISNVPAALLLEPFSADKKALLLGVNIGGCGTLIASLASLISYKFYNNSECAKAGGKNYMLIFTVMNIIFLSALCVLFVIMN